MALCDIVFVRPLVLEDGEEGVHVAITASADSFEVQSMEGVGPSDHATKHMAGAIAVSLPRFLQMDLCASRAGSDRVIDLEQHYTYCFVSGLQYGPEFRRLQQGWSDADGDAIARLHGRPSSDAVIHPAELDASFQLENVTSTEDQGTRLPFAVDVAHLQCGTRSLWTVS